MKLIPVTYRAVAFALLLFAANVAILGRSWAQSSQPPAVATSPQTPPAAKPRSSDQKPQLGVWHHFGEAQSAPPFANPREYGVWRHFGPGNDTPAVPSTPPAPRPNPAPRSLGLSRTEVLEQQMYDLVNRDRADPANAPGTHGRALPLRWNDRLAEVARAHSLDMLNQGYFAHEDPQGRSVATRVEAAGMAWLEVGENIAIYGSVARAEAAFMDEPRFTQNHRANILSPDFTEVGIGIVQAPDGSLYITQDFYTGPARPGTP